MATGTIQHDEITAAIALWQLNRLGYINHASANATLSLPNKFHEKKHVLRTGAFIRETDLGRPDAIDSVHPIFQERNWNGLQPGDHASMIPSLRLASRLLDDPVILTFFKGMLGFPLTRLNDTKLENACGDRLYCFDKIDLEPAGVEDTWKTLYQLSECVRLQFDPSVGPAGWASTGVVHGAQSIAPDGWSALTSIQPEFLHILRDHSMVARRSGLWMPGTKVDSAVVRTYALLAITLAHEVCHALWVTTQPYARTDHDLGLTNHVYPLEPFCRDQRLAELGSAFEHEVFSGTIHPTGNPCSATCPYGLKILPWPALLLDQGKTVPHQQQRGSPAKWGVNHITTYPVEMEYIISLFDNEIWERVSRFGVRALKPQRKMGIRWKATGINAALFAGESPTIHALRTPDSQASDTSDEGADGIVRPKKYHLTSRVP